MADSKKYDGSQWEHSLRKLTTATEAVENPLYSDGTAITAYALKGNEEHTGTPTPSNPVDVNGVGVRTAQLLDFNTWANNVYVVRGTKVVSGNSITITSTAATCFTGWNTTEYPAAARIPVTEGETIHLTWDTDADDSSSVWIFPNASATGEVHTAASNKSLDYTVPSGVDYITFRLDVATANKTITYSNIMFNSGSTAKPYEPYGYKLPIVSGGVTTNVYLSEPLRKIGDYADTIAADGTVTRNIKKLVLTGAEDYDIQTVNTYGIVNFRTPVGFLSDRLPAEGMAVCTHFELQTSNISTEQSEGFRTIESNRMYLRVSNARYGTVVAFQQYLADQYSAGTPVTVWYVLETPTTETTTTSAIPTTEGANSITVDTTVQPSEFTATWTGWHNAEVKEYDGSDWQ